METTQEVTGKTYKTERDNNQVCDNRLSTFEIEIKEEPKREYNTYHAFDYSEFNEISENTELEQDEYKFKLFEENRTTNDEDEGPRQETIQEVSEKTYKIERDNNQVCANPLSTFEIEIKEEPKREHNTYHAFDYSEFNEISENTELEQDEYKFKLFEENRTTNDEGYFQDEQKIGIIETVIEDPSYERNYMNRGESLNTHIKSHTGEKPYKCEICLKQLRTVSDLKRHLVVHTGEKPYRCEICLTQFSQKGYMNTHLRLHTGEKRFECEICFKQYYRANGLKRHLMVHTGEKSYKCEICLKRFCTTSDLKRHSIVHTAEKSYKCEICFKQFRHKISLNEHIVVHTEEVLYKCDICCKQFSTLIRLKKHLRVHTGENS